MMVMIQTRLDNDGEDGENPTALFLSHTHSYFLSLTHIHTLLFSLSHTHTHTLSPAPGRIRWPSFLLSSLTTIGRMIEIDKMIVIG